MVQNITADVNTRLYGGNGLPSQQTRSNAQYLQMAQNSRPTSKAMSIKKTRRKKARR